MVSLLNIMRIRTEKLVDSDRYYGVESRLACCKAPEVEATVAPEG